MLTAKQKKTALEIAGNLNSLADGEDDALGSVLIEARDFILGLPGVSSGEIEREPGVFEFNVRFSTAPGERVNDPAKVLEAAVAKTLADALWLHLPGTRSSKPQDIIAVYTITVSHV